MRDDPRLAISLAGIPLRNPVILAAGTAGTLDEMGGVMDLSRVGAVVTKSITREPRVGNPPWRILPCEHAGGAGGGMLNAIGLANVGVEAFIRDHAPRIPAMPCAVIASVAGFSIDDYVYVAGALDAVAGLAAIELNVSCPNVAHGCEFGADDGLLAELVAGVRPVVTRARLVVKLSPVAMGRPGIVAMARAAIDPKGSRPAGPNRRPGADAVSIANTIPAMAIDVRTRRPALANVAGGLSGPAIHPIALKLVFDAYRGACRDAGVPIIGIGGVLAWEDAAEFVLAGASAVQMGTALFVDPRSPKRVARGLGEWVGAMGESNVLGLVGSILTGA